MKRSAQWFGGIVVGAILLVFALLVHSWYFKPLRIEWLYARVLVAFAIQSPEWLSYTNRLPTWLDFHSHKLDDVSPAQRAKRAAQIKRDLADLERYNVERLDADARLAYKTLHFYLKSQAEGEPYIHHAFLVNPQTGVQRKLPLFMTFVHQFFNEHEPEAYVARLNLFPVKFSQLIESLKLSESKGIVPPKFMIDTVLAEMKAIVATPAREHMLYTHMRDKLSRLRMPPSEQEAPLARAEQALQDKVYPAYGKLIAYLTSLQSKATANNGAWSLPDGEAYYAWAVRSQSATDVTPQQLYAWGLAEVERVGAEMDAILKGEGLNEGSVGKRVRELALRADQQYSNTEQGQRDMLTQYKVILEEINERLDVMFDIRPRVRLEVRDRLGELKVSSPGPFYVEGSAKGNYPPTFYANTDNTPKFYMRTLAYREGVPGSHIQRALHQEVTDLPYIRRTISTESYRQGWVLYADRLAAEQGFYKTPLDNLGRLREDMLQASRLMVDTGIHWKRWTREQAINYMVDKAGLTEAEAVQEVESAFIQPGLALAPKVGMLKILELRELAKKELGNKFDLKQFHNEVLTHGALPLTVLEDVIKNWIGKRKSA